MALLAPLGATLLLALSPVGQPSHGRVTAFWSPIHATVLSVDRQHKTLTIRYEALETVPAGVRICAVREVKSLAHLRAGQLIEARAETSHAQWLLDDIHIVGRAGSNESAQRMASQTARL